MEFSKAMDALNESTIFNGFGLSTVFSFFGLNAVWLTRLAEINVILLVILGTMSIVFTAMKMYREHLATKKLKKQIKKDEEEENKKK